jgi:hypothetical protein
VRGSIASRFGVAGLSDENTLWAFLVFSGKLATLERVLAGISGLVISFFFSLG